MYVFKFQEMPTENHNQPEQQNEEFQFTPAAAPAQTNGAGFSF